MTFRPPKVGDRLRFEQHHGEVWFYWPLSATTERRFRVERCDDGNVPVYLPDAMSPETVARVHIGRDPDGRVYRVSVVSEPVEVTDAVMSGAGTAIRTGQGWARAERVGGSAAGKFELETSEEV